MMMTTRIAKPTAAVAVLASGLLLAGCSGSTHNSAPSPATTTAAAGGGASLQPGPSTQPTGGCQAGENSCLTDSVVVAALQTLFSYQTGPDIDDPASDAAGRAAKYLAPQYVQSVSGTWSMLPPITGAQWADWKQSSADVQATATLTSDEHPADTADTAYRVANVTLQSASSPATSFPVWVVLTRGGPYGWQITSINTQN